MIAALRWCRLGAQALVRSEIVLLAAVYAIFVITDRVPPFAWALMVLVWLARGWTDGRLFLRTPLDLPIVLVLLWLPVSLWVSTDWSLSLPKVYGLVLSAAFYYAVVSNVTSRRDLAWAAFWLVAACLGIGLAALIGTDWAQGKIVSASFVYDRLPRFVQGIPRSIAGGFARNGVGGTLSLTVPLLASLFLARDTVITPLSNPAASRRERQAVRTFPLIVASALVISLGTLALTQSRGGLLGTAVGLAAVAIWWERRWAWGLIVAAGGFVALLVAGKGMVLVEFLLRMDGRSGTLASRTEVWLRGVLMVQDFPFTGIGIGTYNRLAHALYPFFIAAPDELVAHAHNNLLEVAVDLGIPGLIAFVALLTGFVVCLLCAYPRTRDAGERALIAGLGFGMLAHQVFGLNDAFILGTKPGVLIWIWMALAVVIYRIGDERSVEALRLTSLPATGTAT